MAAVDQFAEAPGGRVVLAGRDTQIDGVGKLGVRVKLVRLEWLLQPVDAKLLQRSRDPDGALCIGAVAEAGVDQDVHRVAYGLTSRLHQPDIVLLVLPERPPPEL